MTQPTSCTCLYLLESQTTAHDGPSAFTTMPDTITVCSPIVMNGGKVTVMPIFTPRLMREMSSAAAQRDWMVTPRSISVRVAGCDERHCLPATSKNHQGRLGENPHRGAFPCDERRQCHILKRAINR